MDSDGFVEVVRKKKAPKEETIRERARLQLGEVLVELGTIFSKCVFSDDINAAFLYGSTARKQNTPNSDLDVAVVFDKYLPSDEELVDMKKNLEKMYSRNVDLVCFLMKNKHVDEPDCRIQNFVEHIRNEGVYIWGKKCVSPNILQYSKMYKKVK